MVHKNRQRWTVRLRLGACYSQLRLSQQPLRVTVKKYLRSEVRFNGLEELKQQLHLDKEASLACL